MRTRRPGRPGPAAAIALLALVLSLTGSGYAATQIARDSVGSRELKRGAVTRSDIKAGAVSRPALARDAVDGSKVARNALTGDDIDESTLVLGRGSATPAPGAGPLAGEGAQSRSEIAYNSAAVSLPPGDAATKAAAACPGGHRVIGGGVRLEDPAQTIVTDAYPSGSTAWEAHVLNLDSVARDATIYAICLSVG